MLHVVVVGGGPAGLIAAEALAKAEIKVTVVERTPTRTYPCVGLLTQRTLDDFAIPEHLLAQRFQELAVFSPTQRVAFVSLAPNAGAADRTAGTLSREMLDALLRRRAADAGVLFITGAFTRFRHGQGDYPILEVLLPDGTRDQIHADVVVGADGVHSRVARALGLAPLPLGLVYQEKLAPDGATPGPRNVQLYFGRKVSADQHGWVLPQGDQLLVGVATATRFGKRVWDMLAELKKRAGSQLDGLRTLGREAFCTPLTPRQQLVYDRVLLVGDAAGLVPPQTHDGLYHAMKSGLWAAETIITHRHVPMPDRLAEFERRWWAEHAATFGSLAKLEATFCGSDRRREALLDLAWDRELQRVAVEAFMTKRRFDAPLQLRVRLKTKVFSQLVKYSLIQPRRLDGDPVGRALPAGENYLELALKSGSGLRSATGETDRPSYLPSAMVTTVPMATPDEPELDDDGLGPVELLRGPDPRST